MKQPANSNRLPCQCTLLERFRRQRRPTVAQPLEQHTKPMRFRKVSQRTSVTNSTTVTTSLLSVENCQHTATVTKLSQPTIHPPRATGVERIRMCLQTLVPRLMCVCPSLRSCRRGIRRCAHANTGLMQLCQQTLVSRLMCVCPSLGGSAGA
jgi:hypothetical protein